MTKIDHNPFASMMMEREMRWFFEQAFEILFSEEMSTTTTKRNLFVTLGICYIAELQEFMPSSSSKPSNKRKLFKEKQEDMAFEYCRSRHAFTLSTHDHEIKDELIYTVKYKNSTYTESYDVIITAVYALKLMEDFFNKTNITTLIPTLRISIPELRDKTVTQLIEIADAHQKKFRMGILLTFMQLSAKILSDDNIVSDTQLAKTFNFTKTEFTQFQLMVLDGLDWNLHRTTEQLLSYSHRHNLPGRVAASLAAYARHMNSVWITPEDRQIESRLKGWSAILTD